jgi:tetratricopeptide (TPR) repeat protein
MPDPCLRTTDLPAVDHATRDHSPATTVAATPLPISERYTLLEEIARGGVGLVFRATDTVLGREVAVKVLQEKFGPNSSAVGRFADEARIAAQLQHPAIPPVHDIGTLPDGRPFLAMKLIKGQTLDQLLAARSDPAAERGRFVAVFEQICQAVAYAHAHDVIHRDLKPANVMVGAFGEVHLMDWGLAKVLGERPAETTDPPASIADTQVVSQRDGDGMFTQAGSVLGTPAFMPPEQAIGAVDQIDARSDVFGLGGLLVVVLTGRPPFLGETVESTRQLSAKGKVQDSFAQLDACGADPELIALCKHCLAPEKEDRPADGGVVARTVAQLRSAADERARRAELDRVRVEGEKAAAEARSIERRKRRRLWLASAAALVLVLVGGLSAVLIVQRQANADLAAKNRELADEQDKVQKRFELAQKAIGTYHTGVSEDMLLKNVQFKDLRTRLLKEAAGFYGDLEKLLEGQTDAQSRRLLASSYFQLGNLMETIGSQPEAIAVHRKALDIRRELAAVSEADLETRLDVARSLQAISLLLKATGDLKGALATCEEQRDLAQALATESATGAARSVLASSYNTLGRLLADAGKPEQALASYEQARTLRQQLADANPTVVEFLSGLAATHNNIGLELVKIGQTEKALAAHEKARDLRQQLVDANPTNPQYLNDLAEGQYNLALLLRNLGRLRESLAYIQKAQAHFQKLADTNPAVIKFQSVLLKCYIIIGRNLQDRGDFEKTLEAYQKACVIGQRLAEDNPTVTDLQTNLATVYNNIGSLLAERKKEQEALVPFEKARVIQQKLLDANPTIPFYRSQLAITLINLGYLHAHVKHFKDSFAVFEAAERILQKLADDHPTSPEYPTLLGYICGYRGWSRIRFGQDAEAALDLRRALKLWAKDRAADTNKLFEKGHAFALLAGLAKDPKSGVTTAEAATFADQAVANLQDAIKAGWAQRDELKEPDFDPLRGREDFQKLVKDLEAKAAASGQASPDKRP